MEDMEALARRVALSLPDVPRWVEVRSLLFSGECEVFGLGEPSGFVVRDPEDESIFVAGRPSVRAMREAVAREWEDDAVFSPPEGRSRVSGALPGWERGSAVLHLAKDLAPLFEAPAGTARLVASSEVDFDALPEDLRTWLTTAFSRDVPVAAESSGGRAVSFCCAASESETLWDISVDTLPAHRNLGYAARCVSVMTRHMLPLRPVWAAEESNAPSMRLAAKLGFSPVDELDVFRRPP